MSGVFRLLLSETTSFKMSLPLELHQMGLLLSNTILPFYASYIPKRDCFSIFMSALTMLLATLLGQSILCKWNKQQIVGPYRHLFIWEKLDKGTLLLSRLTSAIRVGIGLIFLDLIGQLTFRDV